MTTAITHCRVEPLTGAHSLVPSETALSRVVTLTPAPAIDRVYFLNRVEPGCVNRVQKVETYLAGKGVNVARALQLAGNRTLAVVPISGEDLITAENESSARALFRGLEVPSRTRINAIVVDAEGVTTNFNEVARPLTGREWIQLCELVLKSLHEIDAGWLVVGGSLPINLETGEEVDPRPLFQAARSQGVSICLDTSSAALMKWANPLEPLDLIKPNTTELSELTGIPLQTLGDVVTAANILRDRGVRTVLASLGPDGILEVSERGSLWARGPSAEVKNTTGAGDAALAGYLSALPNKRPGAPGRDTILKALSRAVSWGTQAVQQPTTILPRIAAAVGIAISEPVPDYPLNR
jgi:1-phosphofructokinase